MNRNRPFLNKYTKRKQLQISDTYHSLNMRQIKPITSKLMQHNDITINNSKGQKIRQVRSNEIERDNKLLLNKIMNLMKKQGKYSISKSKQFRTKINTSLNIIKRKRQQQQILQQNRKIVSRIQNKKATLNIEKLNKDWKDNQNVIKRMQHYEFYLTSYKSKQTYQKSKIMTAGGKNQLNRLQNSKISKIHMIDGYKMMIKIQFVNNLLKIIADTLNNTNLKVIQIPKNQAIIFIQQECHGKLQQIIDKLKYNRENQSLYINSDILAEDDDIDAFNPEIRMIGKKYSDEEFIQMTNQNHHQKYQQQHTQIEKNVTFTPQQYRKNHNHTLTKTENQKQKEQKNQKQMNA